MRQEANYEVHIVGYKGTDFSEAPNPFFLNDIDLSTQGFACIATSERDELHSAYNDFALASAWCELQDKQQSSFGVHVKLEHVKEQCFFDELGLEKHPELRCQSTRYIESPLVSAWDVHLDGIFNPHLREVLHQDGYIILDYLSSSGESLSTLTMHFLRPEECQEEYSRVCEAVKQSGGFRGNIYYEDPLAFVVYGNTIPRPIVCGFG